MYYHVILGTKHIDLIQANSEKEAIMKIEKMFGPAKRYSRNHKYQAVKA